MTCPEGQDGTTVHYQERLVPPWWVWCLAIVFAVSVGVAYGYALGAVAGIIAGIALGVGTAALLVTTVLTIRVDDCVVRAGRARLPLRFVGDVVALDPADSARARTRDFDPASFTLLRTWSAPCSVRIAVADSRDPHPFWLLSARDPERLAAAIRTASLTDPGGRLGSDGSARPTAAPTQEPATETSNATEENP